jgi:hypothetical protein
MYNTKPCNQFIKSWLSKPRILSHSRRKVCHWWCPVFQYTEGQFYRVWESCRSNELWCALMRHWKHFIIVSKNVRVTAVISCTEAMKATTTCIVHGGRQEMIAWSHCIPRKLASSSVPITTTAFDLLTKHNSFHIAAWAHSKGISL